MFSYNVKLQKKIAEKRIKDKERREKGHARSFDLVLKMWKENERESKVSYKKYRINKKLTKYREMQREENRKMSDKAISSAATLLWKVSEKEAKLCDKERAMIKKQEIREKKCDNKKIALYQKLLDVREKKRSQWRTWVDSEGTKRCAETEMPVDECVQMCRLAGGTCRNCKLVNQAEFVVINDEKVYYKDIESYLIV